MVSEELKAMCDALSLEEKRELAKWMLRKKEKPITRGEDLLEIMGEVLGIPTFSSDLKDREFRYTWGRTMVAYQLLNEGYTTTLVGKMQEKNHATICYARQRMETALAYPNSYSDIITYWNDFQSRI